MRDGTVLRFRIGSLVGTNTWPTKRGVRPFRPVMAACATPNAALCGPRHPRTAAAPAAPAAAAYPWRGVAPRRRCSRRDSSSRGVVAWAATLQREDGGVAAEEEEDDEDEEEEREPTAADLDAEARGLLQWPELSAQVRAFTATTLGMRACTPALPLGESPEESQRLLDETSAAAAALATGRVTKEMFEGCRDVRMFVRGAAAGQVLNGSSLEDVATTAGACTRIYRLFNDYADADADAAMAPLRTLAAPLNAVPLELEPEIRRCILIPGGAILDAASPTLAAVRAERRAVSKDLAALLKTQGLSDIARHVLDTHCKPRLLSRVVERHPMMPRAPPARPYLEDCRVSVLQEFRGARTGSFTAGARVHPDQVGRAVGDEGCGAGQGVTPDHFSAQPEPFLTQKLP